MAKRKNKRIFNKLIKIFVPIILLIIAFFINIYEVKIKQGIISGNEIGTTIFIENSQILESKDNLYVYYIDVGQADSILILNKEESCLIDAGNNEDGKNIVDFIKSKGISKLNYVIGTHPHEDHIGGMDDVIKNFDIGKIYLPDIQTTTNTFENVLLAIEEKNLKISILNKGDFLKLGNAEFEIMTESILDKDNLNLACNIIKMDFYNTKFLFTGDAEKENENLNTDWQNIDFLKVGHHGSITSSSSKFINQVKPKYAIISVGKNNDYGHPNKTILERLKKIGTKIYRTDENGTIEVIIGTK